MSFITTEEIGPEPLDKRIHAMIETENRPGSEAKLPLGQKTEQPAQEQLEQQLKVMTMEDLEQCQRDEQELKDAGLEYDSHDGPNSATSALFPAISWGLAPRIFRLLLAKGGNPTTCTDFGVRNRHNALHYAALTGNVDAVDIFTESFPTEVDAASNLGYTALMWAAWSGSEEIVSMLLARGAKPDTKSEPGDTPLTLAATGFGDRDRLVRLLREHEAK